MCSTFYFALIKNQYKMTQYNTLNVKLSNSQRNKLKSGIKSGTEITFKLPSSVVSDSNDENSFPHNFLLTNTQVSKLRKAFPNNYSANIQSSKTQLHKIGQSGVFLGCCFGSLLKTGLPFMNTVFKPLGKTVLIPLGLTAVVSATDAAIHKQMFEFGKTTLAILNE